MIGGLDYYSTLEFVFQHGTIIDSRIGKTYEMVNFHTQFPAGQLFYRPGMNRNLGWWEAFEVIAGTFTPSAYKIISPKLVWEYGFDAAYGLKIAEQLAKTVEQLRHEPETRRAIVHIGQPGDAGEMAKPCVDSYQFLVRDGRLNMIASIRSWDLVMGFIYDTMVMGLVTITMADVLRLQPGTIYANAGSAHIYDHDIAMGRLPKKSSEFIRIMRLQRDQNFDGWEYVKAWAENQKWDLFQSVISRSSFAPEFIKITSEEVSNEWK